MHQFFGSITNGVNVYELHTCVYGSPIGDIIVSYHANFFGMVYLQNLPDSVVKPFGIGLGRGIPNNGYIGELFETIVVGIGENCYLQSSCNQIQGMTDIFFGKVLTSLWTQHPVGVKNKPLYTVRDQMFGWNIYESLDRKIGCRSFWIKGKGDKTPNFAKCQTFATFSRSHL